MTVVRPLRALRYDSTRVDLSRVIAPPYDVIARDERGTFFERDPHNAVRFELTRDVAAESWTDYSQIRETLAAWRKSGVLVRDAEPALYVMRQRFTAPGGSELLERVGFFAELALCEYAERIVRPHEFTMAAPKADRLKLLRATEANLSSVFMLYADRGQVLAPILAAALAESVLGTATDDLGVEYTLAAITDPERQASVQDFLADRPVVIADGHHRYETALAYRKEMREKEPGRRAAPWESTLAYFANLYAPGSLLLPIHRVVRSGPVDALELLREKLTDWRHASVAIADPDGADVSALLDEHLAPHAKNPSFAADDGSGELRIFWREESLGDELIVRILEREVLAGVFELDADDIRDGALSFPKSASRAAQEVREEPDRRDDTRPIALYLNPLTPDDVLRVTDAGERMPQKSTIFWPKVPTGLVFRIHEEELEGRA